MVQVKWTKLAIEDLKGNSRIIYKIIDFETIHILTIHHSSRDLTSRKLD
jgi:mRNA-degrading endonuclease RelE of RelBE toxin-antitoxin system